MAPDDGRPAVDASVVLTWLQATMRRTFQHPAPPSSALTTVILDPAPRRRSLFDWLLRRRPLVVVDHTPAAILPKSSPALASPVRVGEAWRSWPELASLARAFGLTDDECRLLVLAAAPELDSTFPAFCLELFGQPTIPTFALGDQLFPGSAAIVTAQDRPLRRYLLLEIFQPGGTPLLQAEVHASEWAVERLRGGSAIDPRLSDAAQVMGSHREHPIMTSQQAAADALVAAFHVASGGTPVVTQLCGPGGDDKKSMTAYAAQGVAVHRLRPDALSLSTADVDLFARLWEREALMTPIALFLDLEAVEDEPEQPAAAVRRFVDRCDVPIVLATREPWRGIDRAGGVIDLNRPSSSEQEGLWRGWLPEAHAAFAGELSAQFDLGIADIGRIALEVGLPEADDDGLPQRLWSACRSAKRPQLERLAERIPNQATLADLVLESGARGLLDQLTAQVRHRSQVYDDWEVGARTTRGLGITAVFAGESGTGKTLAAEAIASELDLDLYRIDLSAVVDKYVGETEKHIRRTFEAGEDGGVILFFDEADALFGKRTEVKESHDRFANIEINYLLQRIETYRGLVILATNAKSAMDQAFLRRIRFIINFPFPGETERLEIWRRTLPEARRGPDLDLARLARLNVAGGNIRNIGVNALFLAAADGEDRVSLAHARQAAADEFRKVGRPWNEELLGTAADGSERAA